MHYDLSSKGRSWSGGSAGVHSVDARRDGPRRRFDSIVMLGVAAACGLMACELADARWRIGTAQAQTSYPSKPVKIVVGMPPGTFTDSSARLMADSLRLDLREPFIVENRPGAATNIATAGVARAPNDGYTLLLSSNSNTMNVSLFKELPFDVIRDFQPIAMIAASSFILVISPSLPVSTLQELIAYAKTHPDVLNFASTGAGTANHLAVEMLAAQAGIKVTTVFYKGSAEGIADILGDESMRCSLPP